MGPRPSLRAAGMSGRRREQFELALGGALCINSSSTVHKIQMQPMEQFQDMSVKGSLVWDKAEIKD